jgi:hypothetical protein
MAPQLSQKPSFGGSYPNSDVRVLVSVFFELGLLSPSEGCTEEELTLTTWKPYLSEVVRLTEKFWHWTKIKALDDKLGRFKIVVVPQRNKKK